MLRRFRMTLFSVSVALVGMVVYGQKEGTLSEVLDQQDEAIVVVVFASDNASITSIVITENGEDENVSDFNDRGWTRQFSGDTPVRIVIRGSSLLPNDSSAQMTVKASKNGTVFKKVEAKGANIVAILSF